MFPRSHHALTTRVKNRRQARNAYAVWRGNRLLEIKATATAHVGPATGTYRLTEITRLTQPSGTMWRQACPARAPRRALAAPETCRRLTARTAWYLHAQPGSCTLISTLPGQSANISACVVPSVCAHKRHIRRNGGDTTREKCRFFLHRRFSEEHYRYKTSYSSYS